MARRHVVGRRGERAVERRLADLGWQILDRNWRAGHAEVDLVVRRGGVVAFVEVKTRSYGGAGDPLEALTPRKRREIQRAAAHWIRERGWEIGKVDAFRFDAAAVTLVAGRNPDIRYLSDAWRIGECFS